jgi:hypothetical protein
MKKILIILSFGLGLTVFCSRKEPIPTIEASCSSMIFTESSSLSTTIDISSNTSWNASVSDSWINVSPSSGPAGKSVITVTAENGIEVPRSAKLVLTAKTAETTINIFQDSHSIDREALVALFKATGGAGWTFNSNWLSSQPISFWKGVVINEKGRVTELNLSGNNLSGTIPPELGNMTALTELYLEDNSISGEIPSSLEKLTSLRQVRIQNNFFEGPLPRNFFAAGVYCISSPQKDCHQVFAEFDTEGQGTYADGECVLYHKAAVEKGFNIFITGDGFVEKNNSKGGTAERIYTTAADSILSDQVFSQLKDYYNIYIIYSISPERGITIGKNIRNNRFGSYMPYEGQRYALTDPNKVLYFIQQSTGIDPTGQAVVLAIHSLLYGGIGYGFGEDETSLGVCLTDRYFTSVMKHEVLGHGVGKLADEYISDGDASSFPLSDVTAYHKKGWYANVDITDSPLSIQWSKFLYDKRYDGKVGIFEGAYYRKTGVWRPSESSMMNDYHNGWNVPSREALYKRIMKMSTAGWKYDYEAFVRFDAPMRNSSSALPSMTLSSEESAPISQRRLPPPIIINGTWRDYCLKSSFIEPREPSIDDAS